MKQPVFGLPAIDTLPREVHPAYMRLEAEIRGAGWTIVSPEEAEREGGLFLRITGIGTRPSHRLPKQQGFCETPSFQIERIGSSGFLIHHEPGMEMVLEEIRRQFVAIAMADVQEKPSNARFQPRVPLRAIRLGRDLWDDSSFLYRLEGYSALGFNGVLLDGLDLPLTTPPLADENRAAEWEPRLGRALERLARRGWWTMVVLPIGLDLGSEQERPPRLRDSVLCRQHSSTRRRLLHRFESLIRRLPEAKAFGFAISNWGRCDCHLCQKETFEEESAYYLRAYSAVMKRYRPQAQLWFVPDRFSWNRLQEVRSQIPDRALALVPEPSVFESPPSGQVDEDSDELNVASESDGEIFEIVPDFEGGWLDWERFRSTASRWDQDSTPLLAAVNLNPNHPHPANLAAFVSSVWKYDLESLDHEEWVYRLVLSPDEWKNWQTWRDKNGVIRDLFSRSDQKETTSRADPRSVIGRNAQRPPSGLSDRECKTGEVSSLLESLSKGHRGQHHHAAMSNLDLIDELSLSAKRWLGEAALSPLLDGIERIEDGTSLTQSVLVEILNLHEELQRFLTSESSDCFRTVEKRCLEDLEIFLSLTLSEWKNKGFWRKSDLPDLWITNFLHNRRSPPG